MYLQENNFQKPVKEERRHWRSEDTDCVRSPGRELCGGKIGHWEFYLYDFTLMVNSPEAPLPGY